MAEVYEMKTPTKFKKLKENKMKAIYDKVETKPTADITSLKWLIILFLLVIGDPDLIDVMIKLINNLADSLLIK